VFQIEGGAGLGLTYVTGALVKVGQFAAAALKGGRAGWVSNLLLWARWWQARSVAGWLISGSTLPRSGLPRPRAGVERDRRGDVHR